MLRLNSFKTVLVDKIIGENDQCHILTVKTSINRNRVDGSYKNLTVSYFIHISDLIQY